MKKSPKQKDTSSVLSNLLRVVIVIVFAGSLIFVINNINTPEEDQTSEQFTVLANVFREHVSSAHWKWRAGKHTSMIMLIHYDKSGKEVNRSPVKINANGWPTGEFTADGCKDIWDALLARPMRVDGFKVIPRLYDETTAKDQSNYWCRYSLSSGSYFDYFPATGTTNPITL
jgi:hypothetical protein